MNGTGEIDLGGRLTYRETQPGPLFRSYAVAFEVERSTDWDEALGAIYSVGNETDFTLANFWVASVGGEVSSSGLDPSLTRGGPVMARPDEWEFRAELASSDSAQTQWAGEVFTEGSGNGDLTRGVSGGLSVRPAPAWQLSFTPSVLA